jgi:histidine ammonia-lyase
MNTLIKLIPGQVQLDLLERIYRSSDKVKIDPDCKSKVDKAAEIVSKAANGEKDVYGINTGFGKLASTRIASEQTTQLQRNLILSHCCGVGEPLPDEIVRLIIVLKMLSLARGASGVRWQIIEQLQALIDFDIIPIIPEKGSVGASGDLAPLSHLAAVMIGEGSAFYNGRKVPGGEALKQCGLKPIILGPKEGLGLINGTQVSTALALAGLFDAWRLTQSALITGAMASDALMASTTPFRSEIHELRGLPGQISAGKTLRGLLTGSQIRKSHRKEDERVQDPYCLRCQPQVMGAVIDLFRQVARTLEIEANAVTDNPLVLIDSKEIISGGNFHAEPVAFAADLCAMAISEIGSITERRIATLVDPSLNYGLPAFLSPDPGLNSGFMIAEVTAAALMSENKQKAAPCSIDSTPTSANQEDHVSMACHAARRLLDMNQNLASIIGIELLTAAQGLTFREPLKTSVPLQSVSNTIRVRVPRLEQDRYLADDIQIASELVMNGALVGAVKGSELPGL